MGRNRELKRKIAGLERVIESHEDKIRLELLRPQPDEDLVFSWRREIDAARKRVARLSRRLKREW
jgi:predicted RNase H-like nuclease (RuvC/YqgF family)